ncbi:MAG: hypothetical protein K0R15_1352 [Clostridiales bacterium]|nr:hypothetical protein [Clostridiales bacterium]
MPNINRIRVNNVKYNNGTQFYDDFNMNFQGKNTLYDLANGGGKSVLMLLLLQNIIPNSTLDDKQPIEKLFRTNEGSNVIHSLIEWNLDEYYTNNIGYEYMTTGFCAKKGKDSSDNLDEVQKETAAIEYFNYCIFYKNANDNDIRNLPLVKDKERITYKGLRKYLVELSQKNTSSILVKIFDKKYEYQNFLSEYGIYESEWEIIRGINKTEGHVRTYFETKYRTTRKVVEDLLIEEIIQKSFNLKAKREDDESELAQTLLDIKDKLFELSKRKKEISSYDNQIDVLRTLSQKAETLEKVYIRKNQAQKNAISLLNALNNRFEELEGQYNQTTLSLNENEREQNEISRKIATLEYQVSEEDKKSIEKEIATLEENVQKYEEQANKIVDKLNHSEASNEYLDYISLQKSYDTTASVIMNIQNENKDLLNELETYVFNKKIRNQMKIEHFNKEHEILINEITKIETIIENTSEEERKLFGEFSIKENKIKELTTKLYDLISELAILRQKVNVLLLEDLDNEIQKSDFELKESKEKIIQNNRELIQVQNDIMNIKIELEKLNYNITSLASQKQEVLGKITKYKALEERKNKVAFIYAEPNTNKLLMLLNEKYREVISEHSLKKLQKDRLVAYKEQLELNIPLEVTPETRQLLEYVEKKYKNGALGLDIMKKFTNDKLNEVLARVPLLPYSVVVTNDIYVKMEHDTKLFDIVQSSFIIPIINKSLLDGEETTFTNGIIFASKDIECFTNPEKLQQEKLRVKKELAIIEKEIETLLANEIAFKDNASFIDNFISNYEIYISEWDLHYNKITKDLDETIIIKEDYNKKLTFRNERLEFITLNDLTLNQLIEEYQENIQNLKTLKSIVFNIESYEKDIKSTQIELDNIQIRQSDLSEIIKSHIDTREVKKQYRDNITKKLRIIEEEWNKDYKIYLKDTEMKILSITDDELDIHLSGAKKAFEDKNTDIKDKNALLESYKNAIKKSKEVIIDKKGDLNNLELMHRNNTLLRTNSEDIAKQKEERTYVLGLRNSKKLMLENLKNKVSNICGKLEIEQKQIKARFGILEYVNIEPNRYLDVINDSKKKRQSLENAYQIIKRTHKQLNDEVEDIKRVISKLRDLIEFNKIIFFIMNDIQQLSNTNYAKHFDIVKTELEQAEISANKAFENFEKNKISCINELEIIKADALAKGVKDDVLIPRDTVECTQLVERLVHTCETIIIERNNIESSIRDIEAIKDSFENQCLQRCNNVKVDLDKFARLSSIILDDEQTQVIKLKVPYIKEEQQKYQISRYIDNLIEKTDEFTTDSDKKKHIMSQLSLKKLFSVIVTDMNRISLELYKRERIKENSRHFRYEEAVGSTGQSQGIYIQFLIAIINYISNINSFKDTTGLKKVIFIDNPFGAAKDTYIWDPIFNMLETNKVQLVVPTRGATPAITGRFDVNYILVQKMVDGKQQTVVSADYRSEIDTEATEYIKAEYKQESLFRG